MPNFNKLNPRHESDILPYDDYYGAYMLNEQIQDHQEASQEQEVIIHRGHNHIDGSYGRSGRFFRATFCSGQRFKVSLRSLYQEKKSKTIRSLSLCTFGWCYFETNCLSLVWVSQLETGRHWELAAKPFRIELGVASFNWEFGSWIP